MNKKIIGDRYQVIYLLGKKPGYRTLLCSDTQTQQPVVVKFMVWGEDFEWKNLKLFEREAQTLKSLAHPAIPRYLDYFEVNKPNLKGFALVQNYIKATSLEEHLQAGRTFSIEEVQQLGESLLGILIYLHSQKPQIIHRDIKPSNILLTNRSGNNIGDVYLVDFGSVKTLAASSRGTMTVVGTYGYMSPEHFSGKAIPSSDLYSLGATLVYLLTGMHPANLPQKDGRIQFEKLTNCPLSLANWLKQMIEPIEEWRFPSAKLALQSLKNPSSCINYLAKSHIGKKSSTAKSTTKPFGSKIYLKKDKDKLEMAIPALRNNKLKSEFLIFLLKICSSAVAVPIILLMVITFPISIFRLLPSTAAFIPFTFALTFTSTTLLVWFMMLGVFILWTIKIIAKFIQKSFNLFRGERLIIEKQKLILSYDWFGCKSLFTSSISLKKIDKLVKKLVADDRWEIMANAGKDKYKLASTRDLTEVEIDWLCDELSNYLNLPIENK